LHCLDGRTDFANSQWARNGSPALEWCLTYFPWGGIVCVCACEYMCAQYGSIGLEIVPGSPGLTPSQLILAFPLSRALPGGGSRL
jgi:hypothetical protein